MVLFFAVISASIDAYLAGVAYNTFRKMSLKQVIYAGSFTFFACVLAMSIAEVFLKYERTVEIVGGLILVFFGLRYLISYFSRSRTIGSSASDVTMLGLAVSADAACVSASFVGQSVLLCSSLMCAFHTLFLYVSSITVKRIKAFDKLSMLSGAFLIILGMIRIF